MGSKVYVGNLSYQTSWQQLKDHFRQVLPLPPPYRSGSLSRAFS